MAKKKYVSDNAQLMVEWDWEHNNALGHDPKKLSCSSHTQVFWCCPKCTLSYPARISDRVYKNSGCSYCAGKKPLPGVNDLETWCKANGRTDLLDDWNSELHNGKSPQLSTQESRGLFAFSQISATFSHRELVSRTSTNAPILILDEATSSVDTVTEQRIRRAMLQITRGRTSIIIAHRLSTIRDSDLILLMEDGRIAEQGDHEELMALNGRYARMYRTQTGAQA